MREANEDKMDDEIRKFIRSTGVSFFIDDGNEEYFRYWEDDGLKIRTCHECKISEFKSPQDGHWIIYFTKERFLWCCEATEEQNYGWDCALCKKWTYKWRE